MLVVCLILLGLLLLVRQQKRDRTNRRTNEQGSVGHTQSSEIKKASALKNLKCIRQNGQFPERFIIDIATREDANYTMDNHGRQKRRCDSFLSWKRDILESATSKLELHGVACVPMTLVQTTPHITKQKPFNSQVSDRSTVLDNIIIDEASTLPPTLARDRPRRLDCTDNKRTSFVRPAIAKWSRRSQII